LAGSGREVKIDRRDGLIGGSSSVDLAHLDLTGCERRPKQHRIAMGYVRRPRKSGPEPEEFSAVLTVHEKWARNHPGPRWREVVFD
jgi:hypothetical protein